MKTNKKLRDIRLTTTHMPLQPTEIQRKHFEKGIRFLWIDILLNRSIFAYNDVSVLPRKDVPGAPFSGILAPPQIHEMYKKAEDARAAEKVKKKPFNAPLRCATNELLLKINMHRKRKTIWQNSIIKWNRTSNNK